MLEYAKVIHEAIGIQSPRAFIALFALVGFFFFGAIGWLIDKGYRVRLQEQATNIQEAVVEPPKAPPQSSLPQPQSSPPDHARVFTKRTPRELLALYEGAGRTALQADKLIEPYKRQWIKVQGRLQQLIPDSTGYTAVLETDPMFLRPSSFPAHDIVNARFDMKWERELSRINTGDVIKIQGKISDTQNGHQLYLLDCELAPD